MERKRKLPARAAARVEYEAKRRDSTPRERSEPQGDLASKDFQFTGESGVLAESFSRSRNHWIKESLFEKYWTKPHKRKGITNEDSRNPPKDSMTKAGTATITIEPHTFEATMYIVRDTELKLQQPPPPPPPQQQRPIIQYGPPGSSKPSQILNTGDASPAPLSPAKSNPSAATPTQPQSLRAPSMNHPPPPPAPAAPATPSGVLARPPSNPPAASTAAPPPSGLHSAAQPNTISGPSAKASKPTAPTSASTPGTPAAHDPIIALLAQRASGDATLRDLMKRIAVGQGKEEELQHFQTIVNQLNAEYPKTGGQQVPSADRLLVDGKTVKYFADEVCVILEIVLASNPNQRSADLRPPPFSNPVVVALLKRCLDEKRVKDMCRRIAMSKSTLTDATDLKDVLDQLVRGSKSPTLQSALAPQHVKPNPPSQIPNDHANGHVSVPGLATAPIHKL